MYETNKIIEAENQGTQKAAESNYRRLEMEFKIEPRTLISDTTNNPEAITSKTCLVKSRLHQYWMATDLWQ